MPAMFPLAGGKQLCVPPWHRPLILLKEEVCSLHRVSSWGWTWEGTWKWNGFPGLDQEGFPRGPKGSDASVLGTLERTSRLEGIMDLHGIVSLDETQVDGTVV